MRFDIETPEQLREHLIRICDKIDFSQLTKDVQAFIFQPKDVQRVLFFSEYIRTVEL